MTPRSHDEVLEFMKAIPKVELHLHMEGAIPLETLFNFIQRGGDPSINTIEDLQKNLTYTDFEHFIDVWIWKNTYIKQEKDFEDISYQVLQNLRSQNVKYAEAFYSPGDFQRQGLSTQGITESLIEGKEKAYQDFGIQSELIVDIVRGDEVDTCMQRLDDVTPYLGKGVIGIGLGGNEHKYPADLYAPVYREAKKRGFRLTAHAGEAAGARSMWSVIKELQVERIGHGVRAFEDPGLVSFLKEFQIPLEMCVTSNVRTGVCQSYDVHPIRQYYLKGLMVTVNSDDPTMFNTTLDEEYATLAQNLGFSVDDLKKVSMNGITSSFMADKDKELMKSQFEKEWQHLLAPYEAEG
ncbi:MAG: adenosine deaminase [Theionarchaea archaeon]|nr:adenosine deaminase [Theionarchaea archaeon]